MTLPIYLHVNNNSDAETVVDNDDDDDDDAKRCEERDHNHRHDQSVPSSCSSSVHGGCGRGRQPHGAAADTTTAGGGRIQSKKQQWAIALFSLCAILLFADQNLMAPNLTAIAKEFGFDEVERDRKLGGQIALAFFVLGAPASFVVGCLGDTYNRAHLLAGTVAIGEGACLATFFSRNYMELYVCRAITGFSIGGALPLIYSIMGDMFVAEDRHRVSAWVGIGTGVGISLGQGISGFVGPTWGWRAPFLLVSLPALFCAAMVFLTVDDPERGSMEEAVIEHRDQLYKDSNVRDDPRDHSSLEIVPLGLHLERGAGESMAHNDDGSSFVVDDTHNSFNVRDHWTSFLKVISTPTVLLTMLQGAPGCVPWGIVNTYLNDFLSQDRGMSVEHATFTVLIFGIGNFLGMLLSGAVGSYLYRIDKRYPAILAGSMAILGCFPFWFLLNGVDKSSSFPFLASVAILAGATSAATGPIVKATLQNVTLPNARGQAFALFNTFDDFGRGLGPVFVAVLITRLGGRTPAFNAGVLGWVLCGVFNLGVFWTVEPDERRVQVALAAGLSMQQREYNSQQQERSGSVIAEDDTQVVCAADESSTCVVRRVPSQCTSLR